MPELLALLRAERAVVFCVRAKQPRDRRALACRAGLCEDHTDAELDMQWLRSCFGCNDKRTWRMLHWLDCA